MTRRPRAWAAALAAPLLFAAGCGFPVSMPMAPLTGEAVPIVTGSVGPAVEEEGVSARLGRDVWSAVRPAVATAVDRGEDGERFAWRSGSGLHSGTVQPIAAYFGQNGEVCRRLAITVARSDATEEFLAEACRGDGESWRVTPLADQA